MLSSQMVLKGTHAQSPTAHTHTRRCYSPSMERSSPLLLALFFFLLTIVTFQRTQASPNSTLLFREYIGAESAGVKLSHVPVHPDVEFHFILSFAIDYNVSSSLTSPQPTEGKFGIFWDTHNLTPSRIADIKRKHKNIKVALSVGGDTVNDTTFVSFSPVSVDSWVDNAVCSLTKIIQEYNLDGVDIDYEHFDADPEIFVECIGRVLTTLKGNGVISFASIAPYDNATVQSYYIPLWRQYGHAIDYVNFQFYAYNAGTTVAQFLGYFEAQRSNYEGGKILASLSSEGKGGLIPEDGFFSACKSLMMQGKLAGIFIWCADASKESDFRYEKLSQNLLAGKQCK